MKALIVDDDVLVCQGLKSLIPWSSLGIELIGEARNGEEALHMIALQHPDLVITDIRMPIMDGLQLCQRIHETFSDISIILLSAHEDFEYAREAIRFGVKNYLIKPLSEEKIDQLIDEIKRISVDLQNKSKVWASMFDAQMEKDIRNALETGDIAFINDFFEKLIVWNNKRFGIKELCIRMIGILHDFFDANGTNKQLLKASKQQHIDDLIQIKNADAALSFTFQIFIDSVECKAQKRDSHIDAVVTHIKNYMDQNYTDPDLSLSMLAESSYMTSNYISLIFKKTTGISISTYITEMRITKACELLKNPRFKMYDVASTIGYTDVRYFARVFKRSKGITPSEYRNANL